MKLTKDIKFAKDKLETLLKANTATLYDFLSQNRDMGKVHPTYAFQFFIEQLVEHSQNVPLLYRLMILMPWQIIHGLNINIQISLQFMSMNLKLVNFIEMC